MSDVPIVLQWNKRDLEGSRVAVLPVEELEAELNGNQRYASYAASALQGAGVKETFKKICMMTVVDVSARLLKERGVSLSGSTG